MTAPAITACALLLFLLQLAGLLTVAVLVNRVAQTRIVGELLAALVTVELDLAMLRQRTRASGLLRVTAVAAPLGLGLALVLGDRAASTELFTAAPV